jgi:hypothetical protein
MNRLWELFFSVLAWLCRVAAVCCVFVGLIRMVAI